MTALSDHIAEQQARGQKLTMLALCPVRGCLSFAPVGQHCGAHWVRDLVLTMAKMAGLEEDAGRVRLLHGAP